MKLAVPEHQGRVAPVFDCCRHVLIVRQSEREEGLVGDEDWSTLPRLARAGRLRELTVELLLCGGISCCLEEQVHRHGIVVIPWIAGEVWDVLGALRQGRLFESSYAMPGRIGCRSERFKKRNRWSGQA
jgi:hypothetical protein